MESIKTIENDILFSYLKHSRDFVKQNLILEISKNLPDSYVYVNFSGKELIDYLQKTGLMYLDGYLESIEKEFSYLDRNSLYEKDEVLFIMDNNEIVGCAAIKIDPNGLGDDTVAGFSFVDIREYDRNQGLARFLIKQRFDIVKNKFPNVHTIIVSSFSDLGKNLVRSYKDISKNYSYNVFVSNPGKEKILLDEYVT